jgi:hypothetical protein
VVSFLSNSNRKSRSARFIYLRSWRFCASRQEKRIQNGIERKNSIRRFFYFFSQKGNVVCFFVDLQWLTFLNTFLIAFLWCSLSSVSLLPTFWIFRAIFKI